MVHFKQKSYVVKSDPYNSTKLRIESHIKVGIGEYPFVSFCAIIGITFNDVTFLFKIDHDDGTVNTNYARRKLDMNHPTVGMSSIGTY